MDENGCWNTPEKTLSVSSSKSDQWAGDQTSGQLKEHSDSPIFLCYPFFLMPPLRTARVNRLPTKRERIQDAARAVREALYALGVPRRKPRPMVCADDGHKRRQFVILNVGANFLDYGKLGRYAQFVSLY